MQNASNPQVLCLADSDVLDSLGMVDYSTAMGIALMECEQRPRGSQAPQRATVVPLARRVPLIS